MNRIAQFFGVSAVAVMKWIRAFSERLCPKIEPSEGERVIVMEVDEFCHYLKKRNKLWIFKAYDPLENDLLTGHVGIILPQHSRASMTA